MGSKGFSFRKLFPFVYLGVAIYYYCSLDREKAMAWLERVAVKAATAYAQRQLDGVIAAQKSQRRPASPERTLNPAPPQAAETKPGIVAKTPELKIGQTLKFHYRIDDLQIQKPVKEQSLEWELVSSANKQFRWEDSDGTVEIFSALQFLPPLSASGNYIRRAEKNVISGDVDNFFPLFSGKSAIFAIQQNDAVSYGLTCAVGQEVPVTTPAGVFKTILVTCSTGAPLYSHETFNYSPQLNHWVVHERDYSLNGVGYHLKAELTGFTFPDPSLRRPAAR
jgi:hypothetical protein